jgi:hypothetical protein
MISFTSCTEDTEVLSGSGLTHVPKNLSKDLVKLDLSNNDITEIKENDFRTLKKVKTIDLSYNQIQNLHDRSFECVYFLQDLDLSYNNIVHLPNTIFRSNVNLKKLYLKKNSLQISGDSSEAQHILDSKSLIYLDISFCNITYIPCESLEGLSNLKTLITDGNPLIQQNFEIENPPKNLSKMKPALCNSSVFEKFCCNLQEQGVETTSRILSSPTEDKEKDRLNEYIKGIGIPMCVGVFIVVVIGYVFFSIRKNRKANQLAIERQNSVKVIQNRPLPQPPSQDDEYEVPTKPNNESTSSVTSSNIHFNRNCDYNPVPSEENDSQMKTYITTYHMPIETNNGSAYSLSGSTEYNDNVPYTPSIDIYSSSDVTEEEENNLPVPSTNGKSSSSTNPHFSGAYGPSTSGITPLPCQTLGYCQDGGYLRYPQDGGDLEKNKAPIWPTPTSPASPTRNVTKFSVKKVDSEKVFVSSTSIDLGHGS